MGTHLKGVLITNTLLKFQVVTTSLFKIGVAQIPKFHAFSVIQNQLRGSGMNPCVCVCVCVCVCMRACACACVCDLRVCVTRAFNATILGSLLVSLPTPTLPGIRNLATCLINIFNHRRTMIVKGRKYIRNI